MPCAARPQYKIVCAKTLNMLSRTRMTDHSRITWAHCLYRRLNLITIGQTIFEKIDVLHLVRWRVYF
jgi:hypothetical protein